MKQYFVKTYKGLEHSLAGELKSLGAQSVVPDFRGVHFEGDREMMYKVNYQSRLALRVLEKIAECQVPDEAALYDQVYAIDWPSIFDKSQYFCVDAVGITPQFNNTQFTALKTKDAIVDRFRAAYGSRPSIRTDMPDYRIHVHLFKQQANIYLDSSDASLHLRGYRRHLGKAPLSEVLAAGMIHLSGWDKTSHLVDPMCGSGTLLMEAAMMAMNWPAQYFRKDFGFFRWLDFDSDLWEKVRSEANDARQMELAVPLLGYDQDPVMVRKAKDNVIAAHCYGDIRIAQEDFFNLYPEPNSTGTLIFNPPYDDRLRLHRAADFFKRMSDHIKHHWKGYKVWVLLPDTQDAKAFSLKPFRKFAVMNGPTPCTFTGFDVY
jgi:putative N6-adenine-specific DNA methylase